MNEILSMITIDPEFEHLIPPLKDDELAELRESIKHEGIRDKLVVWDDPNPRDPGKWILVDGHNRYHIAEQMPEIETIPLKMMHFDSREAVKLWIIHNQQARRNLNEYQIIRLKSAEQSILESKQRGKSNQAEYHGNQYQSAPLSNVDKSARPKTHVNTQKEIAAATGFSTGKVAQAQYVERHAPEEIRKKAESGEIGIHEAYRKTKLAELPPEPAKPRDIYKEAREQHEAFREEKKEGVVDFGNAVKDRRNVELIRHDFTGKISSLALKTSQLRVQYSGSFDEMFSSMAGGEKSALLGSLNEISAFADFIRKKVCDAN